MNDDQIKTIIFESFPKAWQNDYYKSHYQLANDTISQVVGYINLCKTITDDEEERYGKKCKAESERIQGGGNMKKPNTGKNKTNTKKYPDDNNTCYLLGHGGQKWGIVHSIHACLIGMEELLVIPMEVKDMAIKVKVKTLIKVTVLDDYMDNRQTVPIWCYGVHLYLKVPFSKDFL